MNAFLSGLGVLLAPLVKPLMEVLLQWVEGLFKDSVTQTGTLDKATKDSTPADLVKKYGRLKPFISVLLLSCLLSSCATEYVFVRLEKEPLGIEGVLEIAENKTKVHVRGTEKVPELELGGWIVIHPRDLAVLVEAAAKVAESESDQ